MSVTIPESRKQDRSDSGLQRNVKNADEPLEVFLEFVKVPLDKGVRYVGLIFWFSFRYQTHFSSRTLVFSGS